MAIHTNGCLLAALTCGGLFLTTCGKTANMEGIAMPANASPGGERLRFAILESRALRTQATHLVHLARIQSAVAAKHVHQRLIDELVARQASRRHGPS